MYQNCVSKSDKCQLKVTHIYSEKNENLNNIRWLQCCRLDPFLNAVQKIKEKPMLSFLESQEQYRKSQAIG